MSFHCRAINFMEVIKQGCQAAPGTAQRGDRTALAPTKCVIQRMEVAGTELCFPTLGMCDPAQCAGTGSVGDGYVWKRESP